MCFLTTTCLVLHQLQKKATFQSKKCSRSAAFFLLLPPATFTIKGECDKGNAVWCSVQAHTLCLTASWPPVAPTIGTLLFPRQGANLGWACLPRPLPSSSVKVCVARLCLKQTKMQSLKHWAFIVGFCAKSSVILAFSFPAELSTCSQPLT